MSIRNSLRGPALLLLLVLTASCRTTSSVAPPAGLAAQLAKLPRTEIAADLSALPPSERQALTSIVEAAKIMEEIYWDQVWPGNDALRAELERKAATGSAADAERLQFFLVNKGPWDRLEDNRPFIGSAPKPEVGGFYPADVTRAELEAWAKSSAEAKADLESVVTVIRRVAGGFRAVPYSEEYAEPLTRAARHLDAAAAATADVKLRTYLQKLSSAFRSNDYYAGDFAWMDLDGDLEVVLGPYEIYEDRLFGYKAAFEAFVTIRDRAESAKLASLGRHLPDMERALPMPDEHKNPNRGTESPIRVVNEVFTAGDARTAVQTAAFNLPNDEKVREAKGSKKVLLKNVMEAKYRQSGRPIAERVLDPAEMPALSFDAYFNHVLFHEFTHALGPGIITGPDGARVDNRLLLKELYSAIEECKADVLGVWGILYAFEHGLLSGFSERELHVTNAGLLFRSMRFGLHEAHGRGVAVQWNWYRQRNAILPTTNGRYRVDSEAFRTATIALATELLLIEATGDYARGKKLLDTYGVANAEIDGVIARLADIPVDLAPVFTSVGEKM